MVQFQGVKSFDLPIAIVTSKLSDAAWLVGCLPEAQVTGATPDRVAWKLKPKLSFITGSLDATIEAAQREPGKSVTFRIVSKAIGASSTTVARLEFHETATGADVQWTGELVEVTGLLKMVPKGLIQGTAEKVIEDVWTAVNARLNSGT